MSEAKFRSSLTPEQIEENFKETDFFKGIADGLNEALAYKKGNARAETFARKRSLPAVNVSDVRTSLNMTQKTFAQMLGVSRRTVESWECGRTTPTPTAKKLIYLIQEDSSLADKLMNDDYSNHPMM